jgi:hypothetical protein
MNNIAYSVAISVNEWSVILINRRKALKKIFKRFEFEMKASQTDECLITL